MADTADAVDEFAQTRGGDDLFDDEIIPVATEEQVQTEVQPQPEVPEKLPESTTQTVPAQTPTRPRGAEKGRGRGRGRGRGGRGTSGNRRSEGSSKSSKPVENVAETESADSLEDSTREKTEKGTDKDDDAASDSKAPSASNGSESPRVPAVRGDRSATGGIRKPKLTEEQLSQRIAAAKENAAKLSAAHARAEADQASFLEREKVAEEKRRQERQERRVMDSERERNRQRKLNALNGREWDATKQEEDYNPRGGKGQFRRGMHGGVSGYTRRDFDETRTSEDSQENPSGHGGHRGRGRGGGRGGRGRANSRGPRKDSTPAPKEAGPAGLSQSRWAPSPSELESIAKPTVPEGTPKGPAKKEAKADPPAPISNEAEFPALPGSTKEAPAEVKPDWPNIQLGKPEKFDWAESPVEGTSWADQVESQ